MSTIRAVIDVGTNSVKLLVAEVSAGRAMPLLEESEQTRLGAGFYETHRLQPGAIAKTAEAIRYYGQKARENGAESIRVIATSAARDALNADQLKDAVRATAGLEMEIISGEQEAEWVFQGVGSSGQFSTSPTLILDVGGGSTEFILGEQGHARWARSFPLGTVRLLERFPPSDPPRMEELASLRLWLRSYLENEVATSLIGVALSSDIRLVGTGGTSTLLAKIEGGLEGYHRESLEKIRLSRTRILERMESLWGMSHAERERIPGLPAKRADVILMGVAIYGAVIDFFQFKELEISTRGLRFAAVLDPELARP